MRGELPGFFCGGDGLGQRRARHAASLQHAHAFEHVRYERRPEHRVSGRDLGKVLRLRYQARDIDFIS